MFYLKDIDIFFKDFGEKCFDENDNEFSVIFDNEYLDFNPYNTSKSISTQDLGCLVKNTDIKAYNLKAKVILYINGEEYIIKNVEYDRSGVSELKLQFNEE